MQHPSDETLKLFAESRTPREDARAVVAHLLKGCPACAAKIKAFLQPEPVAAGAHEALLKRFENGLGSRLAGKLKEVKPPKPPIPPDQPPPRSSPKGKGRDY